MSVEPNFKGEKTVRCQRCHEWVPEGTTRPAGSLGRVCRDLCYSTAAGKPRKSPERNANRNAHGRLRNGALTRFRKRVRARDGEMCRFCGRRTDLQVHHIILRSQGGPDLDWNGITLCGHCHEKVHRRTKFWQPFLLQTVRMTPKRFLTVPEVQARFPDLRLDEIPAWRHWRDAQKASAGMAG